MLKYYTSLADKWQKEAAQVVIDRNEPAVRRIPAGVFLPLRCKEFVNPVSIKRFYEGGVVDCNYAFVAGFERNRRNPSVNFSCRSAYVPREIPEFHDKTVIFGGLVFGHLGHLLVDGLSRVWYALEHPEYPVYFLSFDNDEEFPFTELLDLLGLDYHIVRNVPVQCREIIVPDESVYSLEMSANIRWLQTFEHIRKSIWQWRTTKKIYFTRRKFAKQDGLNEEYFEEYYRKLGYTVVAPEDHTLKEQITMIAGAEKIACTMGTMAHLALFARDGIQLDVLLRDPLNINKPHLLVCACKNFRGSVIEATKNFLPTHHADGIFLYCPGQHFKQYCLDNQLPFTDVDVEKFLREHCYDYLKRYAENYGSEFTFKKIRTKTIFDLIDSLSYAFFEKRAKRGALGAYDVVKAYDNMVDFLSVRKPDSLLRTFIQVIGQGWQEAVCAMRQTDCLSAVRIETSLPYRMSVYLESCGWTDADGSYDGLEPIRNFSLTCTDPAYRFVYRAHDGSKWLAFVDDGQDALPAPSPLYGLHIFVEKNGNV